MYTIAARKTVYSPVKDHNERGNIETRSMHRSTLRNLSVKKNCGNIKCSAERGDRWLNTHVTLVEHNVFQCFEINVTYSHLIVRIWYGIGIVFGHQTNQFEHFLGNCKSERKTHMTSIRCVNNGHTHVVSMLFCRSMHALNCSSPRFCQRVRTICAAPFVA